MKRIIGITQRVDVIESYQERRDALDQSWCRLLVDCGLVPLVLPNNLEAMSAILEQVKPQGLLLTGGNSLVAYGGDAPERDAAELFAVDWFRKRKHPILGVCRGMQVIQDLFSVVLVPVTDQVSRQADVIFEDESVHTVNSFHDWGTGETADSLLVWARSKEGLVKAIQHKSEKIMGIMWHPERIEPFRQQDKVLISAFFNEV